MRLGFLLLAPAVVCAGQDLHVSPSGPSLESVLEAAAEKPGTTVWIASGVYELQRSLRLDARHSGIALRAMPGEEVRLSGARVLPIESFGRPSVAQRERLDPAAKDQVVVIDLKALGIKDFGSIAADGAEVFFDDRPLPLARWPNEGFATDLLTTGGAPFEKLGYKGDRLGVFTYAGERPERWLREKDLWLHGYWFWDWEDIYQRVASLDPRKKLIYLQPPVYWNGFRDGARYFVLNALSELDQPGEWYLDREERMLYLWPPQPLAGARITLSMLRDPVIAITNASRVVMSGLTIEGGRNNGIEIAGGAGNVVSGCTVRNLGGWGIVVTSGNSHTIERCQLSQLGRGGVLLAGGERTTLEPGAHAVIDSRIFDYARLKRAYAPGVKLAGVGHRVQNNEIFDAPHIAVWFAGNDHLIERNEIRGVCRETGDAGAIYAGRDWTERGTVIRHNYIHDVSGLGEHGCQAIYLDDMASGIVVTGNITRGSRRGILMGGGRDNVVEDNVLMDCTESVVFDNRGLKSYREAVKPPDGVMVRHLAQMPVDRPPWSTRHPELQRLLADNPGSPKNNVIRRNIAWRCPPPKLAREVVRFGRVEDNEPWFVDPGIIAADGKLDLPAGAPIVRGEPALRNFPADSIGPRPAAAR
ncbi:MAG: hypothetical protein QOD26_1285 [Betaproteobacteria bacterium]|jgi:hypothetical protein|nr:hypothetical protein [Betaproteobacteria bacterium]